jgi:tRNA pseudouridine55 synthase
VPELSQVTIEKVLNSFLGRSFQTPPMYSAKKVNGQRLYKLARKNIEVKREPVEIQIKHISLDDFTESTVTFSVICSKGTYIRVLGKEIAEKLETVGYLTSLIRTQVGGYSIDESQSIQEFEASWKFSTN